mgnify:CR=1 FL=1|tara:strand:- start:332 stop:454 length:123 start_codon:yes stop_codon:yes gene_type:complete
MSIELRRTKLLKKKKLSKIQKIPKKKAAEGGKGKAPVEKK